MEDVTIEETFTEEMIAKTTEKVMAMPEDTSIMEEEAVAEERQEAVAEERQEAVAEEDKTASTEIIVMETRDAKTMNATIVQFQSGKKLMMKSQMKIRSNSY